VVCPALLPAPKGTPAVFPPHQHRAGCIQDVLPLKVEVLGALVHRRSFRNSRREGPRGAGCRVCSKGVISATWESLRGMNSYAGGAAEPGSVQMRPLCWVLQLIHVSYSGNWALLVITPSPHFPSLPRTGILF